MRLIDADELMEHACRDRLDSRELVIEMIDNAPTVKPENFMGMSADDLIRLARQQKVEIEMRFEPDGNKTVTIQPWEAYKPICPGPVYVKEKTE